MIATFLSGHYNKPCKVIAFEVEAGWARDVSECIANKILKRSERDRVELAPATRAFVEGHLGSKLASQ